MMNELNVQVEQTSGIIKTNFDDIKKELKIVMSAYENVEVTENNLAESKKDLAFLRKINKGIDDKRKEVKKQYMLPYEDFDAQCKDLMSVVLQPIDEINKQIKTFEDKRINEKYEAFKALYDENIEDYQEYISFDNTLEDNWANVSYKNKDYLYRLSELKIKVRSDLDVIKSLKSEIEDELIECFKANNNNLSSAVQRNTQYLADKERIKNSYETNKSGELVIKKDQAFEMPDLLNKITMVGFFVSEEDAESVEQFLDFNGIAYRKEV